MRNFPSVLCSLTEHAQTGPGETKNAHLLLFHHVIVQKEGNMASIPRILHVHHIRMTQIQMLNTRGTKTFFRAITSMTSVFALSLLSYSAL